MKPFQQAVNKAPAAENFCEKILTVLSPKYFPCLLQTCTACSILDSEIIKATSERQPKH